MDISWLTIYSCMRPCHLTYFGYKIKILAFQTLEIKCYPCQYLHQPGMTASLKTSGTINHPNFNAVISDLPCFVSRISFPLPHEYYMRQPSKGRLPLLKLRARGMTCYIAMNWVLIGDKSSHYFFIKILFLGERWKKERERQNRMLQHLTLGSLFFFYESWTALLLNNI